MINVTTAISVHRCIKTHFTNKTYDCVQQDYKIKGSKTYNNRWLQSAQPNYQKIISKFKSIQELKLFFVVCCLHDVTEIFHIVNNFSQLKGLYLKKIKIINNLDKIFELDCKYLIEKYGSINNSIIYSKNNLCGIINSYQKNKIHIETILVLNHLFSVIDRIERTGNINALWEKEVFKIRKYGSFISNFDKETYLNILTYVSDYVKMNNNKTNKG